MASAAHLFLLLSSLISIPVSSEVFRLVGSSVQLETQEPVPEFHYFSWVFNGTINIISYEKIFKYTQPSSSHKNRVEFNNKTYSLTLKNLKTNDSGLYEAKVSADENKYVAKYNLTVLDPVDSPHLTYHISNDTCNITFTCRGHDLSISSSCNKETCEENTVTSQAFVLSLFLNGSSIICNHSNKVSWRESVVEINKLKQHCADADKTEELKQSEWLLVVLVLVGLSAVLVIIIYCYRKRSRSTERVPCENTVYEEIGNLTQPSLQNNGAATESMTGLETMPSTTVYSTVGKKPQQTSPGECKNTVYEKVEHPKTKMDQGIHNTYETVPDNANPVMPDTIYSTVSTDSKPVKPKRRNQH